MAIRGYSWSFMLEKEHECPYVYEYFISGNSWTFVDSEGLFVT